MNYQTGLRKERIDTLELIIGRCSKAGLSAKKRRLYGYALEEWGITWRKFLEYLTELVVRKIIVTDKDDCWTMKRWKKIEKARERDYKKMCDLI